MTMCSTSLMVPVRLLAGTARALRMAGGNSESVVAAALAAAVLRRKARLLMLVMDGFSYWR
jgi:hypothetical protein